MINLRHVNWIEAPPTTEPFGHLTRRYILKQHTCIHHSTLEYIVRYVLVMHKLHCDGVGGNVVTIDSSSVVVKYTFEGDDVAVYPLDGSSGVLCGVVEELVAYEV